MVPQDMIILATKDWLYRQQMRYTHSNPKEIEKKTIETVMKYI